MKKNGFHHLILIKPQKIIYLLQQHVFIAYTKINNNKYETKNVQLQIMQVAGVCTEKNLQ